MRRSELLRTLAVVQRVGSQDAAFTFADACDAYFEHHKEIGDSDILYAARLRDELGSFPVDGLTRRLIDEVITRDRLEVRKLSPSSVRRELTTLQAILNHAVDMELTDHVVRVRKPRGDVERTVWLDMDQVNRFIAVCDLEFKAFATALFLTGMRLSEAINARWEDVRGGSLQVWSKKGGVRKVRSIPLHERLTDMIGTQGSGWLLKRPCGSQWTKRMVYRFWNRARREFGMPELTPHAARHSFASNLIIAGVDSRTVAELLGHSSMDMMKRYTHLNTKHLSEAVDMLG